MRTDARIDARTDANAKCEIPLNDANYLLERSPPADPGPTDKRQKVSHLQIDKMREYRRQGESMSEISDRMAILTTAVSRWVKDV